jgi:gluconolactonase
MKTLACFIVLCLAAVARAQDMPLSQIIIPGEDWKKVEGEFKPIRFLTSYDGKTVQVWDDKNKLQAIVDVRTAKVEKQRGEDAINPDFLGVGRDLSVVVDRKSRIARFGRITEPPVPVREFKLPVADVGATAVTADKGMLLVGDASDKYVWTYRIGPDGLSGGEKYMTLRVGKGETRSESSDIRIDPAGRFFVATKEGIQVFDPTGRLCGVLSKPSKQRPTSIIFSGPQLDILFMACGTEIYYRVMQAKGVAPKDKKEGPKI